MIGLDFLEKVDVFNRLNDNQLNSIQDCAELVAFEKGELIFKQGDSASNVWIVVEGGVELRAETPGRDVSSAEPAMSFLSQAQAFGWTCFVPPYKYQLSGYCASRQCKLIKLNREKLLRVFEKDNATGFQVMSYLLGIVGKQFEQLQDAVVKKRGIEIMSQW